MRQIILDTETTGLETKDGHRIIEVGCIELLNRRVTGKHFHRYLNPQREIDAGAAKVHGLTQDFLKNQPLFKDILDELLAFIQGSQLIIHNAPFDVGFLNYELSLLNYPRTISDFCEVLDTLTLARQMHPGQRNSLDALCKRYSVDNTHREWHGALLDSELLAKVYLAMTGGQTTLFGESEEDSPRSHSTASNELETTIQAGSLKIIYASETELSEHTARLQSIDKDSKGKCLWKEP